MIDVAQQSVHIEFAACGLANRRHLTTIEKKFDTAAPSDNKPPSAFARHTSASPQHTSASPQHTLSLARHTLSLARHTLSVRSTSS
jgi:hypothetical protein